MQITAAYSFCNISLGWAVLLKFLCACLLMRGRIRLDVFFVCITVGMSLSATVKSLFSETA